MGSQNIHEFAQMFQNPDLIKFLNIIPLWTLMLYYHVPCRVYTLCSIYALYLHITVA